MKRKALGIGLVSIALCATPLYMGAATASASIRQTASTKTETIVIDQNLRSLYNVKYHKYGMDLSNFSASTQQAFAQVFGADANNLKGAKVHLNLQTTTDSTGSRTDKLSGFVQVGQDHFTLAADKVMPTIRTTSQDTVVQDVFHGTLQRKTKSIPIIMGIIYQPGQKEYQVSMTFEKVGEPISAVFGNLFVTKNMVQAIHSPGSSGAISSAEMANTTFDACNDPTNVDWIKISSNVGYTLDGNIESFPTIILWDSYYNKSSSDTHFREQIWGTTQAEDFLGNSGGYFTDISGVHFAAYSDGYDFNSVACPAAYDNSISLSALNWTAWIPDIGTYLSLLGNVNISLSANQQVSATWSYMENRWTGVSDSYQVDAYNFNANNNKAYTEEYNTLSSPAGHTFEGAGELDYATFDGYSGVVIYSEAGWVYTTGTV